MSLLTHRRVLAAKVETTPGTAESLTTSEVIFVLDPIVQADVPSVDRDATGSLSKLTSVPATRTGTMEFDVELAGSGSATDPPWASVLLAGCGMTGSSHVYSFVSPASFSTLTLGLYEDGLFKKMSGAMGNFHLNGKVGEPLKGHFTFTGIWQPPTDVAQLAQVSYAIIPPRFASSTFTIGAVTPLISSMDIDFGNKVHMVEDVTAASGYKRSVLVERDVKGHIDPEATLVATYDPFGDMIAGTCRTFSVAVGTGTNQVVTIASRSSGAQVVGVREGNRGGVVTSELDLRFTATSSGNDELTITLS